MPVVQFRREDINAGRHMERPLIAVAVRRLGRSAKEDQEVTLSGPVDEERAVLVDRVLQYLIRRDAESRKQLQNCVAMLSAPGRD